MNYCRTITSIISLLFSASVYSQHISGAMDFTNPVLPEDSNSISIQYSTLSYFRDYEFSKSRIQTGYTHFGTWHYPRLAIQPNKWLRLEGGALLQRNFGDAGLHQAKALFSLQILQKNFRILFGAIESNLSHKLLEPIMSYDRIIERPVEEGFQVKFNSKRVNADVWLDWQLRQVLNADYPEELTGGLSLSINLSEPGKPWQFRIPLQAILPHKGGQLDTTQSLVTTVLNGAAGVSAEWSNPQTARFLSMFRAETFFTGYRHFHTSTLYPFESGSGWLANLFLKTRPGFAFLATYWNGSTYIAPLGAQLYQSVSSIHGRENYTENKRQLLFFNLMFEKEVFPRFYVDTRITPYLDLDNGFLENSFLVFLSYRNNFRIGRLKKAQ
jgi:hypothetical protein